MLRKLAVPLPDDARTVQAPPGATQLGLALWLYPNASAYLLALRNLGSLVDGNLRLRRQLGISDAATAAAVFKYSTALVSDFERAEAMAAHLQRLQAAGTLTAEQGEGPAGQLHALHWSRCSVSILQATLNTPSLSITPCCSG